MKPTLKTAGKIRTGQAILLCLLLFGLAVWVFLPSLHCGFILCNNDSSYVTENAHINLTLANVAWAFGHTLDFTWLPLTLWSFMLDHQLYGLKPWGYHLTNVLLHAVNTVLVFLVLRRMTGATWRSLMVAALFGLHPLRVESVAWISQRKDVLSTLFWMLTLWAYVRYVEKSKVQSPKSKVYYGLTSLFFALDLMSKPMAVTLPCVLLLLDYWPLERWQQKRLRDLLVEKAPFFLLSVIMSAITFVAHRNEGMMTKELTGLSLSFGARLENALVSYGRYLGKLFWPADLCALYPYPDHWPMQEILLAGLLVLGLSVLVFVLRRQRPYLVTGWLWYLGTLVPVLGLVPVGAHAMAGHYSYIPSLGILIVLVWGTHQMTRGWHYQSLGLGAAGGVLALICIGLSRQQIGYWKDDVSVWRRAIAVTENNYAAHNSLGRALFSLGRLDEAIGEFQEVVRLNPGFAEAHNSLGRSFDTKGRLTEAMACYQKAMEIRPDYIVAQINLGNLLLQMGRVDEAIASYQKALEIEPNDAATHNNLGYALLRNGHVDEAIFHFQKSLQFKPDNAEAYNNLCAALNSQGRFDEVIACFQKALKINPNIAEFHNTLGFALYSRGRLDEAIHEYQEAARLDPGWAETHCDLGFVLGKRGRLDEAIREFQEALRLKPDFASASNYLVITLGWKDEQAKQSTNSSTP